MCQWARSSCEQLWLVVCSAPKHYLDKTKSVLKHSLKNLQRNIPISLTTMPFKMSSVKYRSFRLGFNVLKCSFIHPMMPCLPQCVHSTAGAVCNWKIHYAFCALCAFVVIHQPIRLSLYSSIHHGHPPLSRSNARGCRPPCRQFKWAPVQDFCFTNRFHCLGGARPRLTLSGTKLAYDSVLSLLHTSPRLPHKNYLESELKSTKIMVHRHVVI